MSGCASANKPLLPKFALGAAPPPVIEDEKWAATVNRGDVVYFGLTKRAAAEGEPAWQLVEALQGNGTRVPAQIYRSRPDAFDDFADHASTSASLRRYNVNDLFRAHLVAEQMIAENIVRFMHDNPAMKLLVFLPDDVMINSREVADYVAQKASLQQMILDRSLMLPKEQPPLLARWRGGLLKVVNRAPGTFRNDRHLPTPGLRT